MKENNVAAVIVAGGSGKRMGQGTDKLLLTIGKHPVLYHTLCAFESMPVIGEIILVVSLHNRMAVESLVKKYAFSKVRAIVDGGAERQESVYHGLLAVSDAMQYVAIHDGARCMITEAVIEKTIADAKIHGGAAAAVPVKDTLKQVDENGMIMCTIDRSRVYHVQTPQTFEKKRILACHQKARDEGFYATDDCALMENYGHPVKLTEGSYDNIKITTPEDIPMAERILVRREANG